MVVHSSTTDAMGEFSILIFADLPLVGLRRSISGGVSWLKKQCWVWLDGAIKVSVG